MTAPTKTIRTPAEAELIERYGALRATLPGTAAVKAQREAAFARFERQGLPHRRVEEWKYSDLRTRLRKAAPPAAAPEAKAAKAALAAVADPFAGVARYRLVVVDGVYAPELSDRDGLLADGVEVVSLAELLKSDRPETGEILGMTEIAAEDIAVALNAAFVADGVAVFIAKGSQLSKPLEIVHVASPGLASGLNVRNRLVIGENVDATIIETSLGGAEGSEINLVSSYAIGSGSRLTLVRLQAVAGGATHVSSSLSRLGENVQLKDLSVEAGADFSRHQTFLTFGGENSRADIFGVSMVHGTRHIDQTLVVDHAVPHCQSKELFKTVVDDRASGVFQGKIIVRPDAQKTNGKMMSQTLLLSEEAEMASKPELEIFADDVVCGHGTTIGQIDETQLFYLMARGVPRAEAERLLIEAFLDDVIDAVDEEHVADALKGTISAWLNSRNAKRESEAA